MAVFNIINLDEIKNRLRIEAEFYRPEYVENYKLIEKLPHLKLRNNNIKITDGTHFTPQYIKKGVRFYSAINVKEGYFLHDVNYKFISHAEHQSIYSRCPVKAGDILLRKVGVGPRWSCVVPDGLEEFSIFVSVALIRPSNQFRPEYLSTFINSKYGQLQLLRLNKGISQPDLHLEDIGELIIPIFSADQQDDICRLVKLSNRIREQSKQLYNQAQQLLEAELGLDKMIFEQPVSYEANFSEVVNCHRIDADYYQKKYKQLRDQIKKYPHGWDYLKTQVKIIKPNIDPGKSSGQYFNYIELSNINSSLGTIEQSVCLEASKLPSRAKRLVNSGDVIASAVVGSVDKAAIVSEEFDGNVASTGFFHFRPESISPEYFLILVRSMAVVMQLQQEATGGILSAVSDARLLNVIVPLIPRDLQDEITYLVEESHKKNIEFKQLFEQAKTRVEQLIEQAAQAC